SVVRSTVKTHEVPDSSKEFPPADRAAAGGRWAADAGVRVTRNPYSSRPEGDGTRWFRARKTGAGRDGCSGSHDPVVVEVRDYLMSIARRRERFRRWILRRCWRSSAWLPASRAFWRCALCSWILALTLVLSTPSTTLCGASMPRISASVLTMSSFF